MDSLPTIQEEENTPQKTGEPALQPLGGDLSMLTILQEQENYTVYELTFQRDGLQIYGNLYLPRSDAPSFPTVMIGHGFGGSYSEMAFYAAVLAENGIAGYVFDFCGGSSGSRSDGDTRQMSVLTEKRDMEAVLDGLKGYAFVDENKLFLMGESQGGLVAALLGEERTDDVRGMVLLYPALVIPDDARDEYPNREDIPDIGNRFGIAVGRGYFDDVWDMDVYEEIGKFDKDVLIIHGSVDSIVPISYSEQAANKYPSAELIVLDGAGHGFYGTQREEAASEVVRFLQENLFE